MTIGDTSNWDDFFQQNLIPAVLSHVITTWEKMPKPMPSTSEPKISFQLYCALLRAKDRNTHAFRIGYENIEVDADLEKQKGRMDIVFFPPSNDEDIYLCLEAKRLNAVKRGKRESLAGKYVKEGMRRFVDGKYARFVRHGAMLAYVLDGNIDRAIKNVGNNIRKRLSELRMDENGSLIASTIRPDDSRTKETHHRRAREKAVFRIHHLFVAGEDIGPT